MTHLPTPERQARRLENTKGQLRNAWRWRHKGDRYDRQATRLYIRNKVALIRLILRTETT